MSALEVLLRNFFNQCSNSGSTIDSSLRWRKFCNKLNAAGVLCSEADRDALARLWTQHTAARRSHLGGIGMGGDLAATPDLSFPTLRRLLEQAFAPRYRADVERGLERGAAVVKVWAADRTSMPVEMTEANLRSLAAQCVGVVARNCWRRTGGVAAAAAAAAAASRRAASAAWAVRGWHLATSVQVQMSARAVVLLVLSGGPRPLHSHDARPHYYCDRTRSRGAAHAHHKKVRRSPGPRQRAAQLQPRFAAPRRHRARPAQRAAGAAAALPPLPGSPGGGHQTPSKQCLF
jgi:hypothetical protein